MMDQLTFNILKITVTVCVVIFTWYLVPYIKALLENYKYAKLSEAIMIAIQAAEQTIKGSGQGVAKKEDVVVAVHKYMLDHNITISEEQLDDLIEAGVFTMNNAIPAVMRR